MSQAARVGWGFDAHHRDRAIGVDGDAAGPVVLLEAVDVGEVGPVEAGYHDRFAEGEPDLDALTFGEVLPFHLILGVGPRRQVGAGE